VLVNWAKTWLTGAIPEIWLFALGALFVVVTLFLPKGIVGTLKEWSTRKRAAPEPPKAPVAQGAE
jgi:urea transport system permease protein